jgi:hypothetical protein
MRRPQLPGAVLVIGFSSVNARPSYQKLLPFGSLRMMFPKPGTNAAQQVPEAETYVRPRFARTALYCAVPSHEENAWRYPMLYWLEYGGFVLLLRR